MSDEQQDFLEKLAADVYAWATVKGWNDPSPTFGEAIALLHSECSEALEAYRDHQLTDATAVPREGTAEWINAQNGTVPIKPEGVGSEFADVLIRLLHYSTLFGVDLMVEFERKMAYNWARVYRHGGRTL